MPSHFCRLLGPICRQVALKQLIPDNEVSLLGGALKFRAKVRLWCLLLGDAQMHKCWFSTDCNGLWPGLGPPGGLVMAAREGAVLPAQLRCT